jgi:hypothetical protein
MYDTLANLGIDDGKVVLFLNPIARLERLFRKEPSCPMDLTIRDLPTLSSGMPPS